MDTDENIVVDPEMEEQQQAEAAAPPVVEEKPEVRIPDKFAGKSPEEILAAYQELETELGRKGNEVGQLRRLTDQLLGLEKAKVEASDKPAARQKITSDQLFEDPDTTIAEVAKQAADERVAQSEGRLNYLEQTLYEERFDQRHKGFKQTMQQPEFIEFVRGSRYRQGLVARAAQNDWDAADELFLAWEERQHPAAATDRTGEAKAATLAKSGGSSAAGVVPRNDGKKTYSRAELINMRVNNPDEFDARFQSEFLPAYVEGRVK